MPFNRLSILLLVLAVVACSAGCGGGGGGGSSSAQTQGVSVTTPDLTSKSGSQVSIPVNASGGTVSSASFTVHFDAGIFTPLSTDTIGGKSSTIAGLPTTVVCRYKWVDAQDISVLYASSTAAASGAVIVNIPVMAAANKATGMAIQNASVNK